MYGNARHCFHRFFALGYYWYFGLSLLVANCFADFTSNDSDNLYFMMLDVDEINSKMGDVAQLRNLSTINSTLSDIRSSQQSSLTKISNIASDVSDIAASIYAIESDVDTLQKAVGTRTSGNLVDILSTLYDILDKIPSSGGGGGGSDFEYDYTPYLSSIDTNVQFLVGIYNSITSISQIAEQSTNILSQISSYEYTNSVLLRQVMRTTDEADFDGFSPSLSVSVTNTYNALMLNKIYDLMRTNSVSSFSSNVIFSTSTTTNYLPFMSPYSETGLTSGLTQGELYDYLFPIAFGQRPSSEQLFWLEYGSWQALPLTVYGLIHYSKLYESNPSAYENLQTQLYSLFANGDFFTWDEMFNPLGIAYNEQYGTYDLRMMISNQFQSVSNSLYSSGGLTLDLSSPFEDDGSLKDSNTVVSTSSSLISSLGLSFDRQSLTSNLWNNLPDSSFSGYVDEIQGEGQLSSISTYVEALNNSEHGAISSFLSPFQSAVPEYTINIPHFDIRTGRETGEYSVVTVNSSDSDSLQLGNFVINLMYFFVTAGFIGYLYSVFYSDSKAYYSGEDPPDL